MIFLDQIKHSIRMHNTELMRNIRQIGKMRMVTGTWGHLFPKENEIYVGNLIFAETSYGEIVIIQDNTNIDGSPWWYEASHEFIYKYIGDKKKSDGTVFQAHILAKVKRDDIGNMKIDITETASSVLLDDK